MVFLKNDKLIIELGGGGGGGGGGDELLHFLRNLLLKVISGLKNSTEYFFWLEKLKNDKWQKIKIALKPTGIKL